MQHSLIFTSKKNSRKMKIMIMLLTYLMFTFPLELKKKLMESPGPSCKFHYFHPLLGIYLPQHKKSKSGKNYCKLATSTRMGGCPVRGRRTIRQRTHPLPKTHTHTHTLSLCKKTTLNAATAAAAAVSDNLTNSSLPCRCHRRHCP